MFIINISRFLNNNGLDILNNWLRLANNTKNSKLIFDILVLYKALPLNVDILLENIHTFELISSIADSSLVSLGIKIVEPSTLVS